MHVWASLFSASLRSPEPDVVMGALEVTRGFSRVAAGFSSYEGDFWLPLVLAQGSPIFHSSQGLGRPPAWLPKGRPWERGDLGG